jgi:para-aminobenzoate synthetase component 1
MDNVKAFQNKMNSLASRAVPFVFLIDFEKQKPVIFSLDEAKEYQFFYHIAGKTNYVYKRCTTEIKPFLVRPVALQKYKKAFEKVNKHIKAGDSYLLNLTCQTRISTAHSLQDFFEAAKAPYKLMYQDEFVLFSPETFIKIQGNEVFSYPMKGTIDADIPNAEAIILSNQKELFEHNTIVDLIRNDLSIIAENVRVSKFRYIDKIKSERANLLQVSSEIKGDLPANWQSNLAEMLFKLLPAGSISGAPKQKTLEIIQATESQKRGYYTGIFGIFDGQNLDTAVNIRYIEKTGKAMYYRSGGGITAMSKCKEEYNELKQKIYVPTH